MLKLDTCVSHWVGFKTRLKRPRAWTERAVAAQLMKLIYGSTSRVCLMRSCVSCVEGIFVLWVGGGILITLLSALK